MKKLILFFVMVVLCLSCSGCMEYINNRTIECEINDKWIKRNDDADIYLISCDNEVYKISDLLFKGKFNSSNIYANLKIGRRYKLSVSGYRLPFFSEYQNINSYELIED